MAYKSGLTSAGIMDHDSLSGADEFKKDCKMLNIGSTCGVEVRAHFKKGFGGELVECYLFRVTLNKPRQLRVRPVWL